MIFCTEQNAEAFGKHAILLVENYTGPLQLGCRHGALVKHTQVYFVSKNHVTLVQNVTLKHTVRYRRYTWFNRY